MAHIVHDAAGKPVASVLDAEESVWVAAGLSQYLAAEQERQRRPSLTFPPVVLRALGALQPVADRWSTSGNGHSDDAMTCTTSADGRGGAMVDPGADMLDTKEVATLLNITPRQARRRCEEIGTKVGGRWVVRREDLKAS